MSVTEPRTVTRPTWQPRLAAVLAVTVLNTVLALAAPLFGADLVVAPQGQEPGALAWPAFTVFTIGFALLGWGVLALAERLLGARRGRLMWTVVAMLIVAGMFLPPLTVGATTATVVVLQLAHLVVAAVIPVFWRTSRA
ncbi:DUF6069 family protein [Nocardiopsis sp. L17-MgMaSL7]|uniref:DUF6069 family protein n=1 Tax=Nocardiopsis sp. L17-MgMaSL7 TaxID=1938893 RepID=UPI000D71539C|nr:DUF6069 family protein [Nocardiopsis sp. L17-MgMaSL7]PWV45999.1 hypothetical protein BDW27_11553 [Nocardiopsis sp. L17-MgMaSL7]